MKKLIIGALILISTYLTFGIFVIQPIGMLPEGKTLIYIRFGSNMNFIESADGISLKKTGSVSLFSRLIILGSFINEFENVILFRLPYNETLYLMSTGFIEFEN